MSTTTAIDFDAVVAAGIALLDEKGPADWRSKVDVSKLDLTSFNNCVLGQIYGDYRNGIMALFDGNSSYAQGSPFGFYIQESDLNGSVDLDQVEYREWVAIWHKQWTQLTAAWKAALQ